MYCAIRYHYVVLNDLNAASKLRKNSVYHPHYIDILVSCCSIDHLQLDLSLSFWKDFSAIIILACINLVLVWLILWCSFIQYKNLFATCVLSHCHSFTIHLCWESIYIKYYTKTVIIIVSVAAFNSQMLTGPRATQIPSLSYRRTLFY